MEAIAERWKDTPKKQEAASTCPEDKEEADVKPVASVSGTKGKKNPTLLLAELLQIEGEIAVMQYDTGATARWCPPPLPKAGSHCGKARPLHEFPHGAVHCDGPDAR